MNTTNHDRSPQEKVCGYEYTVRRGDSFYLIANRLGIPLRDLLEANSDINPARLMVGDVLCIPMEEDDAPPAEPPVPETPSTPEIPEPPAEPEPAPPEDIPEEILPDTDEDLDAPATDSEGPVPDDMSVCPEQNRHTVLPGESAADIQLRHNVNRYTLQSANPTANLDQLTAGQVLCVPEQSIACPAQSTYILQTSETLESVALRLNTSLAALLRANPCLSPSDFTAGQCIYIPE